MENRIVGIVIIATAMLIGFITYSFNRALTDIVNESCSHGSSCAMWGTINFQTNVSIGIMTAVIIVGVYFLFFAKEKKVIKNKDFGKLDTDEKQLVDALVKDDGTIFQSDLVDKTKMNKVKVTRVLDRLEGRGVVERKRRGMTNVVLLKQ